MEIMFAIFPVLFTLTFLLVFGTIAVNLVKEIGQWNKNNHSPQLTVDAKVVAKRHHNTRHRNSSGHSRISSTYFVTFEVPSGDRMELQLEGSQFGLLVEGDTGKLTFQGTRYLSFRRGICQEVNLRNEPESAPNVIPAPFSVFPATSALTEAETTSPSVPQFSHR